MRESPSSPDSPSSSSCSRQAQQFMSLYGSIVNDCFKDCINDFTSETLGNSEVWRRISRWGLTSGMWVEGLHQKVYPEIH